MGLGEQGNFIASDVISFLKYTKQFIHLENQDSVLLKGNEIKIFDDSLQEVHRDVYDMVWEELVVDQDETVGEVENNREHHCWLPIL